MNGRINLRFLKITQIYRVALFLSFIIFSFPSIQAQVLPLEKLSSSKDIDFAESEDSVELYNVSKDAPVTDNTDPVPIIKDDLIGLYPNPARKQVTIVYTTLKPTAVVFSLYNSVGQLIDQQIAYYGDQGYNDFKLSLESYSSGLYIVLMETKNERASKKLIIRP